MNKIKLITVILFLICTSHIIGQKSKWFVGADLYGGDLYFEDYYVNWKFHYLIGVGGEIGYKFKFMNIGLYGSAENYTFSRPEAEYSLSQYRTGFFLQKNVIEKEKYDIGLNIQPYWRYFFSDFYTASFILAEGNLGIEGGVYFIYKLRKRTALKLFVNYQHDYLRTAVLNHDVGDEKKFPYFRGYSIGTGIRF